MKHRPDRAILRVTSLDNAGMNRSFEDLVAEADAAPVEGWDFSWLEGRATEERPSWGYQRLMSKRLGWAAAGGGIPNTRGGGGPRGGGALPRDDGRHRVRAAERCEGDPAAAPTRRYRRRRPGRASPAFRRRDLRPGHLPASRHRVVERDRPGAARWRHVLRPARRPPDLLGTRRVLPGPAARRSSSPASPGSGNR